MTLNSAGDLAIVELVYYVPAFLIATFVGFKHGFGRAAGFLFLVILSAIRIVGSALEIAAEEETNPSTALFAWSAILSSLGLTFLINAELGILKRM